MADDYPALVSNKIGQPEDLAKHAQVEEAEKAEKQKQEAAEAAAQETMKNLKKHSEVPEPEELVNEKDLGFLNGEDK